MSLEKIFHCHYFFSSSHLVVVRNGETVTGFSGEYLDW